MAFGQWVNKNVDLVLEAWSVLRSRSEALPLVVVGLPPRAGRVEAGAAARGIEELVTVKPWLSEPEFEQVFTSAALVVFPSDYEGFGLPALEAMRLGIPVVVTAGPGTARGHGRTGDRHGWLGRRGTGPGRSPGAPHERPRELQAGVEHASMFTWQRTATAVRTLAACIG